MAIGETFVIVVLLTAYWAHYIGSVIHWLPGLLMGSACLDVWTVGVNSTEMKSPCIIGELKILTSALEILIF